MIKHLNFYMSYYDTTTPRILIHAPTTESAVRAAQATRFPFGQFPSTISSRRIDDDLYQFWDAATSGDQVRKFLYNYQILEYASYYYLEEDVKRTVRKLLAAPNALSNVKTVTNRIVEAVSEQKIHDIHKIEGLLRQAVDSSRVWTEISANIDAFCRPMAFDGGFVVQPIAKKGWTGEDFATSWLPAFPNVLRGIRNALSHGREHRMAAVITPTTANFNRLQAWIPPLAAVAREVMVYRHLA